VSDYAELAAADAYCRLLAARHYENFTVASRLLPRSLRLDLARVYAYCRTTDDLGDETGEDATARLLRWRDEVTALFAGGAPLHPVLVALRETARRHDLPAAPFREPVFQQIPVLKIRRNMNFDRDKRSVQVVLFLQ